MKLFGILFAAALIVSCNGAGNTKTETKSASCCDTKSETKSTGCCEETPKTDSCCAEATKTDVVEVLSFHGAQRCITCQAIENLTREVVEQDFAEELKAGKLKMTVIDISTNEGESVADNYEVASSSLYINKWNDGKEARNNMTNLGFTKAKNSPDEFKAEIKSKIAELLK